MKFPRSGKQELELNLTPLIDVVFLLLIFFMVSTSFARQAGLAIDLPQASGNPVSAQPQSVEVSIGADGRYAVNGLLLPDNRLESLMQAMQEVSKGNSQQPMTIAADARVSHQSVVLAMDAAGRLGFRRLSITTRSPQEPGS